MIETLLPYLPLLGALIVAGLFAGLVAGLFGIGGGVVIVPTLAFVFTQLGYPDVAMHAAVGCSLATIVATSLRSASSHHKRGAVDLDVVKGWVPFIMIGAVLGALIAGALPAQGMRGVFGGVLFIIALQFIFGRPTWKLADQMPSGILRAAIASGLGALSGIMGIGGGVFGVTLMTLCGHPVHRAVGTAAAFGAAIGFPAALGFIYTGWGVEGRLPFSIGYLNIPAIVIIAILTTSIAPVGAALAHRMNATTLRRVFGVVTVVLSANMLRVAFGL